MKQMKLLNNFLILLQRYQQNLEESMKGSGFVFGNVDLLYYKYHKKSLNHCGSYIDSPKWLKIKKQQQILKTMMVNAFDIPITAALNLEQSKSHPERISNIKPFINQYNWKEVNFPSHKKDWKKSELLLISYMCLTIAKK